MNKTISLDDISIRTELKPGDIGYVIYLHGDLYQREYGYGIQFEGNRFGVQAHELVYGLPARLWVSGILLVDNPRTGHCSVSLQKSWLQADRGERIHCLWKNPERTAIRLDSSPTRMTWLTPSLIFRE